MNFTVTYRRSDGGRSSEVVEAADRGECIRRFTSQGLSVISISEGGTAKKPVRKSLARGFVAGVLVVLLAGISVYVLNNSSTGKPKSVDQAVKPEKKKTVVPANTVKKPVAVDNATATNNVVSPKIEKNPASVSSNETAKVIKTKRPGKPFRIVDKNAGKKRLFHSISDIYISRVVNSQPGALLVGTIDYSKFKDQFLASLEKPIVIEPDDTAEEVAKKNAVIETRQELKARLDKGEDICTVMREADAEARRLFTYRRTLQQELAKAYKERKFDADSMQDYVNAANKMLTDNGMQPLKYPEMWVRRLRQEMATPDTKALQPQLPK